MSPTSYRCSIPRRWHSPRVIEDACAVCTFTQNIARAAAEAAAVHRLRMRSVADIDMVKPSTISTTQLHALLHFHLWPIKRVVCPRSYLVNPVGGLILKAASCLDAFSTYPFQTWLPGSALGRTTGTPEVCPPRSSRTRGSSPQASCAHSG